MPGFDLDREDSRITSQHSDWFVEELAEDEDVVMEKILENINSTPLGKVIKRMASLPEVRQKKVIDVRRRLTQGDYSLNERLDIALDKVLEDLTA